MLGNFPIWDRSMTGTVHFILTIPNGRVFAEERGGEALRCVAAQ